MVRPCVYIDYPFFKFLLKKGNENKNPLVRKNQSEYNLLMDFLFDSGIDLVCHIDEDDQDEFDLIRVLEDYHVQGKVILKKLNKDDFIEELNKIGQRSPFSFCCLAIPGEKQQEIIEQKGYNCISANSFDDFLKNQCLKKNSFEVAKDGDIAGWADFSKLSHEFNTIIFFDSYLFAANNRKDRSRYTDTVSEIICNLIVKNKSKTVNILIAFPKLKPGLEVNESIETLQKNLKDSLKKKIANDKSFTIGLAKISHKRPINHDRLIFTNFMVLFSGDSFNYFEKGKIPSIETVLTSYSILDWQNNFQAYLKKLQKLKKVIPQVDKLGHQTVRSGNCDLEFLKVF